MRRRLERFLQLLAPLLLLPLELLQLLAMVLLQQILELGTYWRLPLLSSFRLQLLFLLRLLPRLLLTLFFLFLPLLFNRVEPDGPRCPPRGGRGLNPVVHRAGVPRSPVAARPITYNDRIPLGPRSGRLGGSLLPLGVRCLDPPWRRWGGFTH
jgi:hypothetical protein